METPGGCPSSGSFLSCLGALSGSQAGGCLLTKSPEDHVGFKCALWTLQAEIALQETGGFSGMLKSSPSQRVYFAVY